MGQKGSYSSSPTNIQQELFRDHLGHPVQRIMEGDENSVLQSGVAGFKTGKGDKLSNSQAPH